jgi:dihydrofolate reductase
MIKAIVAVSDNWCIGKDNKLLFHLPKDFEFFKSHTMNKVVLCGRKTLESFPGNRPLRNRSTICLCSEENKRDDCFCIHNFEEALKLAQELSKTQDIWIIGGQSIYEKFIDFCDIIWVTKINTEVGGDAFFPNLDNKDNFKLVWESDSEIDNGHEIKFCQYMRIN